MCNLKQYFSEWYLQSFQWILLSCECHRTYLMINQHWHSWLLGAVRQKANTWATVDTDWSDSQEVNLLFLCKASTAPPFPILTNDIKCNCLHLITCPTEIRLVKGYNCQVKWPYGKSACGVSREIWAIATPVSFFSSPCIVSDIPVVRTSVWDM